MFIHAAMDESAVVRRRDVAWFELLLSDNGINASGPRRTCRSTDQLLIESTGCGPFCYCLLMALAGTRGPATPIRSTLGAILYTMHEVVAPGLEAKV